MVTLKVVAGAGRDHVKTQMRMDNCYASDRSTHPGWNLQLLAVSAWMVCVERAHFLIPNLASRSIEMTDSRTPFPLLVTPNYQQHAAARESNDIVSKRIDFATFFKDSKSRASCRAIEERPTFQKSRQTCIDDCLSQWRTEKMKGHGFHTRWPGQILHCRCSKQWQRLTPDNALVSTNWTIQLVTRINPENNWLERSASNLCCDFLRGMTAWLYCSRITLSSSVAVLREAMARRYSKVAFLP